MLMRGALEMGHARALLALDAARQIEAGTRIVAKRLSVRETEALVQSCCAHRRRGAGKKPIATWRAWRKNCPSGSAPLCSQGGAQRRGSSCCTIEPRSSRAAAEALEMMQLRYTSAPLRGAKISSVMLRTREAVLTVLRWQLVATAALALAAALIAGRHGAASALAGAS